MICFLIGIFFKILPFMTNDINKMQLKKAKNKWTWNWEFHLFWNLNAR